jgi:hypothetical protein
MTIPNYLESQLGHAYLIGRASIKLLFWTSIQCSNPITESHISLVLYICLFSCFGRWDPAMQWSNKKQTKPKPCFTGLRFAISPCCALLRIQSETPSVSYVIWMAIHVYFQNPNYTTDFNESLSSWAKEDCLQSSNDSLKDNSLRSIIRIRLSDIFVSFRSFPFHSTVHVLSLLYIIERVS